MDGYLNNWGMGVTGTCPTGMRYDPASDTSLHPQPDYESGQIIVKYRNEQWSHTITVTPGTEASEVARLNAGGDPNIEYAELNYLMQTMNYNPYPGCVFDPGQIARPVTPAPLPSPSPVASSGLSSGWIIAIALGALFLFSKR